MAKHEMACIVCGQSYAFYDASPRSFCSVGCETSIGSGSPPWPPEPSLIDEWKSGRGRAAKTPPRTPDEANDVASST